ncbi:MAG: alpha/beta hydrolase [Burkholderiaceae bacterium]
MISPALTEHVCKTDRHTTHYLQGGPPDGPLLIFVHGWPELAVSWRAQLAAFAALGFRVVAPDMRGYGRSSVPERSDAYTMAEITQDMVELLAHLGRERAVWIGHDWGGPVVWSIASHHPARCAGVASLCVPYHPEGFAPSTLLPLIDRELYPADQYPAGQWDYQLYYIENLEKATRTLQADTVRTIKCLFRRGDPAGRDTQAVTAYLRKAGGWFGGAEVAPDFPRDDAVISEQDLHCYASALARNGFFGPDSWYVNPDANIAFARQAVDGGRLSMPVLFLHGSYDWICATQHTRLADPMRAACDRLTEGVIASGHWMQQEKPVEVNAHLARWLATALPDYWPVGR